MSEEINRWQYEPELERYRNLATGRFISSEQVVGLVDQLIDRTNESAVDTLSTMVADQRLSTADWKSAMARTIKNAYIQQTELAAGGRENVTQQMWGSAGGQIAEQYRFLDKFARDIETGSLTEAQIRSRSEMYINSSREAFWRVKDRLARDKGLTEERWIPIGDDATCGPCAEAGTEGWQPIGTFAQPGSGRVKVSPLTSCEGLTRCRCRKEYR